MFETLPRDVERIHADMSVLDQKRMAQHRGSEMSKRRADAPGVGPIGGFFLTGNAGVARGFRLGRDFAAWLGLTPKNHSTAGKNRLGVIIRAGDERFRNVLVAGAAAAITHWRCHGKR